MIQAISAIQDFEGQRLAGVDRVRQRIAEIENKFGFGGIVGQDFQTILNQEMQKNHMQVNSTKTQESKTVHQIKNTDHNNGIETFSNINDTVSKPNVVTPSRTNNIQAQNSTISNSTVSNKFPGEEALPSSIQKSINPFSAIVSKPENHSNNRLEIEEEEVDTPTVETKRLSNNTTSSSASSMELLDAASSKYNVDPRLAEAVAVAESNINQDEISKAGAIGVMQLMPETARGLGVDPYDREQNIDGGVKYLSQMLEAFNGDVEKAVAAYNAGPGAVKKYGGVPPYSETQNYVGRVMDLYR